MFLDKFNGTQNFTITKLPLKGSKNEHYRKKTFKIKYW